MSQEKFTIKVRTFPGQHIRNFAGATRYKDEDTQYLEAKQYIPRKNTHPQQNDITIIGTPAISFPKEMYEPLWDELLDAFEHTGHRIRSIWTVDPSNQGQSGVLNEHTQGDEPTWMDFARDLLQMINIFRDDMSLPIVGIGHSMGATVLMEVSRMHPRLFSSLIVVDPVIGYKSDIGTNLIYMASNRADLWPSREAAKKSFESVQSMQKWDPRVMALWLEHGLRETPTALYPEPGNITLKTTKANESWYYGRSWFDTLPPDGTSISSRTRAKYADFHPSICSTHPFYRSEMQTIWRGLSHLSPDCLYIFPDKGPMSTEASMNEKVGWTGTNSGGNGGEVEGRVERATVKDTGHLLPFEKPKACAVVMSEWLGRDLKTWTESRAFEKAHRDDKSINQMALSARWMREAKANFDRSRGKIKKAKL